MKSSYDQTRKRRILLGSGKHCQRMGPSITTVSEIEPVLSFLLFIRSAFHLLLAFFSNDISVSTQFANVRAPSIPKTNGGDILRDCF